MRQPTDVYEFVRTPFTVRCNVVKAWRPLPADLWTGLSEANDQANAKHRERLSVIGVGWMALTLLAGFSSIGLARTVDDEHRYFPALGWSQPVQGADEFQEGWYWETGQSLTLTLWTVAPSFLGWAFVRSLWIPMVLSKKPRGQAALAFVRYLSSVYLFVYAMIIVGACLIVLLLFAAPKATEFFRWCLWCFLFGESFFVPAVMWARLVIHDRAGNVFSKYRYLVLTFYLFLFVVVPILGMVRELP